MAYDSTRGVTVLQGGGMGASWSPPSVPRFHDTWEWDGHCWVFRVEQELVLDVGHAMAFDTGRGVCVWYAFGQTWEWDGAVWTQRSAAPLEVLFDHAMAYDSWRGEAVLFGVDWTFFDFCDTYLWNGQSWRIASFKADPYSHAGHAMAFDSRRGVTVLFGGAGGAIDYQTWEWDGDSWFLTDIFGPAARVAPAMAYDSKRGVTVLFGGALPSSTLMNDTWEYDGESWSRRATTGPSPRWFHTMAYDSARGVTVLFGGSLNGDGNVLAPSSGETWEWDGEAWTLRHVTCYADWDASTGPGVLDFFDFIAFADAFAASDPAACDCDISTGGGAGQAPVCDFFDFICFQDAFAEGCR